MCTVATLKQRDGCHATAKLTRRDLALVSIGSSQVKTAAIAQQSARVPSAMLGWPFSTRSTVRKGDNKAPNLEQALHTPSPNDLTCVGYTCTKTQQWSYLPNGACNKWVMLSWRHHENKMKATLSSRFCFLLSCWHMSRCSIPGINISSSCTAYLTLQQEKCWSAHRL